MLEKVVKRETGMRTMWIVMRSEPGHWVPNPCVGEGTRATFLLLGSHETAHFAFEAGPAKSSSSSEGKV
jgi:hypothetical protein